MVSGKNSIAAEMDAFAQGTKVGQSKNKIMQDKDDGKKNKKEPKI